MRRLILVLASMLVMTQAHADQRGNPAFGDAVAFFWDGSQYWASANYGGIEGSQNGWRLSKTEDPCIVDIWVILNDVKKTTRVNFRKMPGADAFTISEADPRDYRSFVLQAEARLPDGAICELDKDACPTSWRIWDNRGELFLRHRLRALDYIRNTFCK